MLDGVFWFLSGKSYHLNKQIWIDGAIAAVDEISTVSVDFGAAMANS
jgi:hypothetical protein